MASYVVGGRSLSGCGRKSPRVSDSAERCLRISIYFWKRSKLSRVMETESGDNQVLVIRLGGASQSVGLLSGLQA